MINPPSAPQQGVNQPVNFPNVEPSDEEQRAIVALCNEFKKNAEDHAAEKKDKQRTSFAYSKNKFVGNDLLPTPSTKGSDKDNNKNRPQIFIPVVRQQMKTIYSQMKLTMFPNDQDYFRIRSKTAAGMQYEDPLTEALKYKFAEAKLSEKLGECIWNTLWSGTFICFPCIRDDKNFEWQLQGGHPMVDPLGQPVLDEQGQPAIHPQKYVGVEVDEPPLPDLETFNPLHFYIDPTQPNPEKAKWVYATSKKLQEIKDSALYFNKDKIEDLSSETVDEQKENTVASISEFNNLQKTFEDIEENLKYDLYYFPYLKTEAQEYRNMLVGVAAEQVLVRFHPNLFPRGLNPVVFCSWIPETDNPYSTSVAEELMDLQKLINILWNYKIEVLARAGNRFAVRPSVDMSSFWGVAGGVATTEDPRNDIVNISGDYSEIASIDNTIGVLKAEAQQVAGAQTPFQGSSDVDFKKTATELNILQSNSISILREIIEHVSAMGVQRALEREMYLMADLYQEPIEVPVDVPGQGRTFQEVDFSLLKSGQFTIELVSINPSQGKDAQVNSLTQLAQLAMTNPQGLLATEPIIEKIGDLEGVKNIRDLLDQVQERYNALIQQAPMGAGGQPGIPGPPQAAPPGQGPPATA